MRLRLDAQLRYRESNCLTDQADADAHLLNAKEAASYMALLIRERSPEQERRMLIAQRDRMLREPGAEMGMPIRQGDLDRAAMQRGARVSARKNQ